jgi:signal transduction histidine kinase
MPKESTKNQTGNLTLLGSGIAIVAIVIAIAASWLLYTRTSDLLTQNLRDRLLSISITEAANIDAGDLGALQVEQDWQKPEWAKVVHSLKSAKDANRDIVFMYIFRKTAGDPVVMEFVADAESLNPYANTDDDSTNDVDANGDGVIEPDGADKLQWPGQPYPEATDIPETATAYEGPLTVPELYQDDYGNVLTGYAPIKDENGSVVAILATDIRAGDFVTITQQTLYPFIAFVVFLVLTILALTGALIYLWRKRIQILIKFDEQKNQFLSIASHDLRAPLTVIRNFMSLLLDGTYGKLPSAAAEGAQQVFDRATEMAKSVDNYLNVPRIEQGKMKYHLVDVDLAKIVSDTLSIFKSIAEQKGLKLVYQDPGSRIQVKAEVGKLQEVFNNLIDNSIKYTPTGSISVTLEKAGATARVTIKDTGLGMSKETITNKLFKLFSTDENSKKINPSSTGVGLYVVKAIVEAHRGTIRAESEGEGKGSRFIVELPATSN